MFEQNHQPSQYPEPAAEPTKTAQKESETWASPIEIDTPKGKEVDLGALSMVSLWNKYATSRIVNTGSRLSIRLTHHAYMEAPFLHEKYKFLDFTFHYNVDNTSGNEHIIDDKRCAMEGHFLFVHTYTIDITRNLLDAYKLYDDYQTGRMPIPEFEESTTALDFKPTRRMSPSPSAVTFFIGNSIEHVAESEVEKRELTPLEKLKKKLDNFEQEVFIERWNKERSSRAAKARKPTAYPSHQLMTASALRMQDASILSFDDDEAKAEGAKSAVDRRLVKKYETKAKRKAEKKAHDLAREEYPAWRRRQMSQNDLIEEPAVSQVTVESTVSGGKHSSTKIIPFKETEQSKAELKKIQFKTINIYCCVGVQFELDETAPKYNLFSYLSKVKEPFTEVLIDGNILVDFEESLKSTEFYVYHGSLAVPPYTTGVQWVLMKNPLKISSKQMNTLRSMKNAEGNLIESNFVGLRAWDNRKIWVNKPREQGNDFYQLSW